VLLLGPHPTSCIEWFTRTYDPGFASSIPHQLFEEGYDVWIGCRRGDLPADRTNVDKVANADVFWDFDYSTIGLIDIPAMVADIMKVRKENVLPCEKVQILTHSSAATELLVTLTDYPTSSELWIGQAVNLTPCPIGAPKQPPTTARRLRNIEEHEMDLSNR
jgi:hypothetical protein